MRFAPRLRALLGALVLCASLHAADAPDFLFVIDLSPAMAPRREATLRTVADLIRTGFHERIRPGQTFALWFNGQTLQTNPPIAWEAARATELAQGAINQIPKTSSKPVSVLAGLVPEGDMTAFVLTDGVAPLAGTPFDAAINAEISPRRDRFARAAKPFLITLLARQSEWIAYGVHTQIGAVVELPVASDTALISEALNRVRAADPSKTNLNVALAEAPKPAAPPIVISEPPPQPTALPPDPQPVKPLPLETTAPKAAPVVVVPPERVENKPAPVLERPPPAPAVAKIEEPKPEPPAVAAPVIEPAAVAPPAAEPTPLAASPVVAAAVPKPEPPPQPAPALPKPTVAAAPPSFPWPILMAIFAVIAAGGCFVYLKLKSGSAPKAPAPGSLISQSLPEPKSSKVIPKR
jgi:hypothetical protein